MLCLGGILVNLSKIIFLMKPTATRCRKWRTLGEGYKFHVTALTHDERGYPNMTPSVQDKLVRRLQSKIRNAADRICLFEEEQLEGADVVVVSYGITSRVAQRAIEAARERGLCVGKLRLITAWPFPENKIANSQPV